MFRFPRRPLPRVLLSLLFALGLLVGGLTTPALAASRLPAARTSSTCNGVGPCAGTPATLLIHGVADTPDHLVGGCDGGTTWGPTITFLQQRGWTNVYSLAYYKKDWFCGPNPVNNPNLPESSPEGNLYSFERYWNLCPNYPAGRNANNDGTWNEDDKHVACELAWYIYEYYTLFGNSVNIVAHSLGGALLKEALYQIYVQHNTSPGGAFPPYLYVHQVVTFEAPLDGVQLGAGNICQCNQVTQLEPGSTPNEIHSDLTNQASKTVQASGGTHWTMEGDQFSTCGAGGPLHLGVGPSAFGMDYGLKISYNYAPVPGIHAPPPDTGQCTSNGTDYYYGHGTYLVDTGSIIEVLVKYCINCAGEDVNASGTLAYLSHSLQEMAWGINGRCGVGLASTATCDGIDPVVGGCNNTRYPQSGEPWYLIVYWSTGCSTNWTSVTAPSGDLVTVTIYRSHYADWNRLNGMFVYCAPAWTTCPIGTWGTFGKYTTAWYTDMLYAPNDYFAVQFTTSDGHHYYSHWH